MALRSLYTKDGLELLTPACTSRALYYSVHHPVSLRFTHAGQHCHQDSTLQPGLTFTTRPLSMASPFTGQNQQGLIIS